MVFTIRRWQMFSSCGVPHGLDIRLTMDWHIAAAVLFEKVLIEPAAARAKSDSQVTGQNALTCINIINWTLEESKKRKVQEFSLGNIRRDCSFRSHMDATTTDLSGQFNNVETNWKRKETVGHRANRSASFICFMQTLSSQTARLHVYKHTWREFAWFCR